MAPSIQTTYRHFEKTEEIEQLVRAEVEKLERFSDRITSVHVHLEKPHRHHIRGAPYLVRVMIYVPENEIAAQSSATTDTDVEGEHRFLVVAVQDAFRKAGRRLQDYVRRIGGDVKTHVPVETGEVVGLRRDFGFLRALDGHDVYFHRNSVLGGRFDDLRVGSKVRFDEEAGDKGPQASTVTVLV